MPRFINPVPDYFVNGQPAINGVLYFFEAGTNTRKDTFADAAETVKNAWPLPLDANGQVPNCFYSGTAKVVFNSDDEVTGLSVQRWSRDPVGADQGTGSFEAYSPGITYQVTNIVVGSDGNYYKSLTNNNLGNDPVSDDGTNWHRVDFVNYWSKAVVYGVGDQIVASNNKYYKSVVNSNLNNDPTIDSGTNWQLQNPIQDWAIGRTYLANEEVIGSNGRLYKAVTTTTGNDPTIDSGANWLPAIGKVQKPTNTAPADAATDVSRTPTLTTSAFTVSGGSDTHEYSVYQLSKDSFVTVDYNILTNTDLVSHTVPTLLDGATEYSYRARHKGVFAGLSDWSDVTTFTTTFPLSSLYQVDIATGTGAARTVVNGVDLSANAGTVFIANITDTLSTLKVVDTQRGAGNALSPGVISASEPNGITSFKSDGYSVGTDAAYNANTEQIFSITIRRAAGIFDAVRYSGTGANRTIAHGLSADVGLMFCMQESAGGSPSVRSWFSPQPGNRVTGVFDGGGDGVSSTTWNSTAPTSSVFSLGTDNAVNQSSVLYTMYLLSNKPSAGTKSGSYTGTGVSGNSITTGFATGLVIIAKTGAGSATIIISKKLGTSDKIEIFNGVAQKTVGGPDSFDLDGFTLGSDTQTNQSGVTYYYLAIADENLF